MASDAIEVTTKAAQLREILREQLLSGRFAQGDRIASESELAQQYGISHITVRDALSALTEDGLIHRIQGRGTFVADVAEVKAALSAQEAQKHTFGLVLTRLQNPFYAELTEHIQANARLLGLRFVLGLHHGNQKTMREEVKRLYDEGGQGILVGPVYTQRELDLVVGHAELERKVVVFHPAEPVRTHFVTTDQAAGVELAVRHLYQLGHRSILLLSSSTERRPWSRPTGFDRALAQLGLSTSDCRIVGWEDAEGPEAAVRRVVRSRQRPTAIIAHRDWIVPNILRALRQEGLEVPDDISVVGFDGIALAEQMEIPLTTVSQRIPEIAAQAVGLLQRICEGQEGTRAEIVLQPKLVVRSSTAERR